jgi:hypothetical protein
MEGRKGHAEFSPDGTPNIFLNSREANAEVVVHEVFHLLLRVTGSWVFRGSMGRKLPDTP